MTDDAQTPETKPGPANPQAEGVEAASPPGGPLRQDGPTNESSEGHDDDASANPAANKDAEEAGGHTIPIEDEQPDPQPGTGRRHAAVRERRDLPRPAVGGMTMTERPETGPGDTPETGIEESDPNADSPEGLAGEMGVSSERRGPVRGHSEEVTYGAAPTHPDEDETRGRRTPGAVGVRRAAGAESRVPRRAQVRPGLEPRPRPVSTPAESLPASSVGGTPLCASRRDRSARGSTRRCRAAASPDAGPVRRSRCAAPSRHVRARSRRPCSNPRP